MRDRITIAALKTETAYKLERDPYGTVTSAQGDRTLSQDLKFTYLGGLGT